MRGVDANRVAVEEVCHVEDGDGALDHQTHILGTRERDQEADRKAQ